MSDRSDNGVAPVATNGIFASWRTDVPASIVVALVALVVFAIAGMVATWAPDKSLESLKPRWATPPSQFIDVGGLQVHLRDEGPRDDPNPIVLLHGTSASLHTWG